MIEADRRSARALRTIKLVHTIIWAFFAGCIVAIPILALLDRYAPAAVLSGIVLVEVVSIVANDRRDNFDIYLPEWLARHNKLIFGLLYAGGVILTLGRWAGWLR